jgi:hypothetical protein
MTDAISRLRKIRQQFIQEPTMAGGRWILPSGDVVAAAIDDVLSDQRHQEAYDAGRLAGFEDGLDAGASACVGLGAAVGEVLPRMSHWPKEALGHGWNEATEPHSELCPPCILSRAWVRA